MNDPENEHDFEEWRAIAKQIDKGVQDLEKKISNVNNLGLSLPAEDLKNNALNVLKEYENEIQAMRENCEQCLEEEKKRLKDCVENNEKITRYIEELKNDLDKWETILKNGGNYRPFQDSSSKKVILDQSLNVSEKCRYENVELEFDHFTHGSSQCSIYSSELEHTEDVSQDMTDGNLPQENNLLDIGSLTINNSSVENTTFDISNDSVWNPLSVSKISSKQSKKSCNFSDKNSNISATLPAISVCKKLNHVKEICKTPVDPGISLTSMKLLGRTDIKTKVYKTDLL